MILEYTLLTTLAVYHLILGSILILVLGLLTIVTKSSSEVRSWLWITALIIATLSPFSLISDDIQRSGAIVTSTSKSANLIAPENSLTASLVDNGWHLPSQFVFNFSNLLSVAIIIWLVGSLWRSFAALRLFMRTRALFRSKLQPIQSLSQYASAKVYVSNRVSSPLVVGFWQPKIVLPQSILGQLEEQQLAAIIMHENAHVRRRDNWFSALQELIVIVFWWSPIVRFIDQKIHMHREIACDLRAVTQLNSKQQYAQSLLDCAKLMIDEKRNLLAMGLFNQKEELKKRIKAVLKNKTTTAPNLWGIALACAFFTSATVQAAQILAPRISIVQTASDARIYSSLPRTRGLALLAAVERRDIVEIKALLDQGLDINTAIAREGTALMIAVKHNDTNMAQTLIALGADVNQASIFDGNPLIIAAKNNNIELAQLLVDHGADVNSIVERDETPLINAASSGHMEMCKFLVERGADVNLSVRTGWGDGYELRSPLSQARTQDVRQYLVTNGAHRELSE